MGPTSRPGEETSIKRPPLQRTAPGPGLGPHPRSGAEAMTRAASLSRDRPLAAAGTRGHSFSRSTTTSRAKRLLPTAVAHTSQESLPIAASTRMR
jgi:hypothetical protein